MEIKEMGNYHYEDWNGKTAYVRSNSRFSTQDGHGGRAEQHHKEMREEAITAIRELVPRMIEELVPPIAAAIYNEAVTRLVGATTYDIEACVSVALSTGEEIFRDSKVKQMISDRIMKEIKAQLDKKNIRIDL